MRNDPQLYDYILVGGGIVGAATAWQLKLRFRDAKILLLEKESRFAAHQSGHNSGVVHAGVYYQPGSLKADFCKRGAQATKEFCQKYRIPYLQPGKLILATDPLEQQRLQQLAQRCAANGVDYLPWSKSQLAQHEPYLSGEEALLIPATGVTQYSQIAKRMLGLFQDMGGSAVNGAEVVGLEETSRQVEIRTRSGTRFKCRYLIACAGLMADRIARMLGADTNFRIIPFRGEYYRLREDKKDWIKHLVYPVPDPALPFLGIHITQTTLGELTIGPNATLGWKREGYGKFNFNLKDSAEMMLYRGFWRLLARHFGSGVQELRGSLSKHFYLRRVRKYCPRLNAEDLLPYPAGIRAQAVRPDGSLVDDFLIAHTPRSVHLCNAPSPAATSAIPIAEYLCAEIVTASG